MIPTLCANLDELDEPEAKASLIWIIGEYASKIDNAGELLSIFVDTFTEESYQVGHTTNNPTNTRRLIHIRGPTTNIDGRRQAVYEEA